MPSDIIINPQQKSPLLPCLEKEEEQQKDVPVAHKKKGSTMSL